MERPFSKLSSCLRACPVLDTYLRWTLPPTVCASHDCRQWVRGSPGGEKSVQGRLVAGVLVVDGLELEIAPGRLDGEYVGQQCFGHSKVGDGKSSSL